MQPRLNLLITACLLLDVLTGNAFRSIPTASFVSKVASNNLRNICPTSLLSKNFQVPEDDTTRKVAKYDNLGDPIYEDERASQGGSGLNILGIKVDADPLTVSLLVFAGDEVA